MKRRWLALMGLLFSCVPLAWGQGEGATITSFTPTGTVKQVRQVRVHFSEAMTAMGDPRDQIQPFEIDCPVKGASKWEDTTNWVYDFEKDLPGGTRAIFKLRAGIKTLEGKPVSADPNGYTFNTGGPAILRSEPYDGDQRIDEQQIFVLRLDCPANEASVLASVYFQIPGVGEKIGVRIIKGPERASALNTLRWMRETADQPLLLIQAKRRFPSNAGIELVWGKELSSLSGIKNEKDQILEFIVRPEFKLTVECQRINADAPCLPITPVSLNFSAPVAWSQAKLISIVDPSGKKYSPARNQNEEEGEDSRFVQWLQIKGPFPEKAALQVTLPRALKDDAGRPLSNQGKFPLTLQTDEYPPLVKFAADFGILELNAEPILPVTVRNVEPVLASSLLELKEGATTIQPQDVINPEQASEATALQGKILRITPDRSNQVRLWLEKLWQKEKHQSLLNAEKIPGLQSVSIPKLQGAKSFEVAGIPLPKPGFYLVEIKSEILGKALLEDKAPMYIAAAALVTNLSVHFKWGNQSSLVWVTTLDKARLVSGAHVEIRDCSGEVLWKGETDQDGIARPMGLPPRSDTGSCGFSYQASSLMATAQVGDDFSFVFSNWDDGIEPWRFNLPEGTSSSPVSAIAAHTVFDRPLFRAGETVHMKHFLRRQTMEGFGLLPASDRPSTLVIEHSGSEKKYEVPLKWFPDGTAETNWTIPKEANLGAYDLKMELPGVKDSWHRTLRLGDFRVEEFRLPVLRASIRPPDEHLVAPSAFSCDLQVSYLSGGGASGLEVKFRHQLQAPNSLHFESFDGFVFSNGLVKEQTRHSGEEEEEAESQPTDVAKAMKGQPLTLDKTGSGRVEIQGLPAVEEPKELLTELEYPDPNGEIQTTSARIPIYPSRWLVGIQPDSWLGSATKLKFKIAVAGLDGKPVAQAPVQVELFTEKSYSHRNRMVGGLYAYDRVTETKRVGPFCEGSTDSRGLLLCEAASPVEGNVIIQARVKDPEGRTSAVHQTVWVAGKESWWFNVANDDRIDVLPEKKRYEPGETARFQVRMPFQEATALVSVEREGVSDVYIQKLTSQSPLVELPIKPNYAPNIFVSVLVVRGRVGDVQPTALVDLGRPAYKLGIAEIKVGWRGHELKVQVSTPKDVYQVRQKVPVEIRVQQAGDGQPAAGEVAVAAVDEALLELLPNRSWDLLTAMMGERAYSVWTSTAQMYVIGKRHFGLKALPTGGGGGSQLTRELFDTLLLWQGRLPLDKDGVAHIEIPLNDSLSRFRIVAIASSGAGRFGAGSTSVRSTQDLMVLSGIPPVVRYEDKLPTSFTVRNNTQAAMPLTLTLRITGMTQPLQPQSFTLNPGESKVANWTINVPLNVEQLTYDLQAQATTGQQDHLRVQQKVIPYVPVRPWQSTIFQLDKTQQTPVARPADSLPGQGGIQVQLNAKISNGLPGVIDYMKKYPYSCLEQETSRAVSLREKSRWDFIMERMPAYLDGNGLAKYFPTSRRGSLVLTAYVLAISNEAGWSIPQPIQEQMLGALKGFLEGKIQDEFHFGNRDLDERKLAAMEALSRYGVGLKSYLSTLVITPNLWPTSALIDWRDILKRQPDLPGHDKYAAQLEQVLKARLDFRGTTMGFSTEKDDFRWWLMMSGDVNANRLILSVLDADNWREDMPRLVRGTLGRQSQGRWLTTIANAWGVLALEKFSQKFESQPVGGTSSGQLGKEKKSWDWAKEPKGGSQLFKWPEAPAQIQLEHTGSGKPWAVLASLAAIPLKDPFSNGYRVKRTLTPIVQKEKGIWSRGDIVRVRLECEAQTDMTWVVVNDPIPAGATILGSGLGRDSQLATQGEKSEGWVFPAFEERSQEAFRAYYEYVPKGNWVVEYTMRLNNPGQLHMPGTRVEALYSPEMLGELPGGLFTVAP